MEIALLLGTLGIATLITGLKNHKVRNIRLKERILQNEIDAKKAEDKPLQDAEERLAEAKRRKALASEDLAELNVRRMMAGEPPIDSMERLIEYLEQYHQELLNDPEAFNNSQYFWIAKLLTRPQRQQRRRRPAEALEDFLR